MGTLYAISILAFAALLWAVFSVVHHVRQSHPVDEVFVPPAPRTVFGNRPFLDPKKVEHKSTGPQKSVRPFEFFDPREFQTHPTQQRLQQAPVVEELQTHDLPIHGVRRSPRPTLPPRISDRIAWAHFNKDLGNLNNPELSNQVRNTPPPGSKQA